MGELGMEAYGMGAGPGEEAASMVGIGAGIGVMHRRHEVAHAAGVFEGVPTPGGVGMQAGQEATTGPGWPVDSGR